MNKNRCGELALTAVDKNLRGSTHAQLGLEFEAAADQGEPEAEQLINKLGELHYMLRSPMNSREDEAFTNINPDQIGESFRLNNQRNQALEIIEIIDERDVYRWALNPVSAKDFSKRNE